MHSSHLSEYSAVSEKNSSEKLVKKTKVLNIISGDLWGGKEAQLLLQCSALKSHISGNCIYQPEVLLFNQGTVSSRLQQKNIPHYIISENALGLLEFLRRCLKIHTESLPDIIVSHGYKEAVVGILLHLRYSVPWLHYFHGALEEFTGIATIKMHIYCYLEKLFAKLFACKLIAVSRSLAQELGIENSKKLEIIYNACENLQANNASSWAQQKPYATIVGRLVPVKQVDLALRAWKALIDSNHTAPKLFIVGTGPEEQKLKSLTNDLGLSNIVSFLGFRDDAQEIIANADLLLLTSMREGLPTVILEALFSQTPIVSTAIGGIPEAITFFPEYPAKLLNSPSPEDLSSSVIKILTAKKVPLPQSEQMFKKLFSEEALASRLDSVFSMIQSI